MTVIPTLRLSGSRWCFFYSGDVNQADGRDLWSFSGAHGRRGADVVKDASHVTAMKKTFRAGVRRGY